MLENAECKVWTNHEVKIQVSLLLCLHMQCNSSVQPFLLDLSVLFNIELIIISPSLSGLKIKRAYERKSMGGVNPGESVVLL